jgi:ArsR family metal-binding transcriptional regulator
MRGMADQKAVNSQMKIARVMALLHCSFVPDEKHNHRNTIIMIESITIIYRSYGSGTIRLDSISN